LSTWPKIGAIDSPGAVLDRLEKPAAGILDTGTKTAGPAAPTLWAMLRTLREGRSALDIPAHGLYGYPEQLMPAPELTTTQEVPAS
jgi:hypothetical protein